MTNVFRTMFKQGLSFFKGQSCFFTYAVDIHNKKKILKYLKKSKYVKVEIINLKKIT